MKLWLRSTHLLKIKVKGYAVRHTQTNLSETTQVSRYQKGETNLDFTEARDSE